MAKECQGEENSGFLFFGTPLNPTFPVGLIQRRGTLHAQINLTLKLSSHPLKIPQPFHLHNNMQSLPPNAP